MLIISRNLNVHDFGLFNMAISAMLIASNLSGLGMNVALIKFTSSYLVVKKNAEAAQVLKTTFLVRVIVSIIISILVFNTAELMASKIFHSSSLSPLLKLAAFGVFAISIFNYLKAVLYTYQWCRLSVIVQIFVDFGKLTTVFVFISYLKIETFTAVAAFAFVPLIGALFVFGLLWQKFFTEGKPIQNLFSHLFSYSKWLFTSHG